MRFRRRRRASVQCQVGDENAILRLVSQRNTVDVITPRATAKNKSDQGNHHRANYRTTAKFIEKTHDASPI